MKYTSNTRLNRSNNSLSGIDLVMISKLKWSSLISIIWFCGLFFELGITVTYFFICYETVYQSEIKISLFFSFFPLHNFVFTFRNGYHCFGMDKEPGMGLHSIYLFYYFESPSV